MVSALSATETAHEGPWVHAKLLHPARPRARGEVACYVVCIVPHDTGKRMRFLEKIW